MSRERRVLSAAIGLAVSGRSSERHSAKAIDGGRVVIALGHMGRRVGSPRVLIWGGAPMHRCGVVRDYLARRPEVIVEWLPPEAPEVNPEECCHGDVKEQLSFAAPASRDELQAVVDRGFARLRRRPDLLLSFIRHAGLSVNQLWLN